MEMAVAELLEDFLDEPTCPGTPSGVRLKNMNTDEGSMLRNGQRLMSALSTRRSQWATIIYDKMTIVLHSIQSWSECEPTADVRERVINDYERIMDAVFNKAAGNL